MHVKTKLTLTASYKIIDAHNMNDCSCLIRTGAVRISPLVRSWRNGARTHLPLSSVNNKPTSYISSVIFERPRRHFLSKSRSEFNCQDDGHTYINHIACNTNSWEPLKPSDADAWFEQAAFFKTFVFSADLATKKG